MMMLFLTFFCIYFIYCIDRCRFFARKGSDLLSFFSLARLITWLIFCFVCLHHNSFGDFTLVGFFTFHSRFCCPLGLRFCRKYWSSFWAILCSLQPFRWPRATTWASGHPERADSWPPSHRWAPDRDTRRRYTRRPRSPHPTRRQSWRRCCVAVCSRSCVGLVRRRRCDFVSGIFVNELSKAIPRITFDLLFP